ncbi:MAG: alpha/beta hydrolase-fold protein [Anaerolineales bacterium]
MKNRLFLTPVLVLAAAGCASGTITATPSPTIMPMACTDSGNVQTVDVDASTRINVYLPPCYGMDDAQRYPTVYLFPGFGGTKEAFIGSGAERIAEEMTLGGEIPPMILVGTNEIFPDLDAALVVDKILPYVDANFRTRPEREYRAAAGGSFGGGVAYHLAFRRYDLFATAGIFGNGAAVGEEEPIRAWLAAIPAEKKPRVFINVGENDTYMLGRAKVLIPLLDEAGIAHTEIFSPGGHSGDYWIGNFAEYFRWLSLDWR